MNKNTKGKVEYKELARANVTDSRSIVISSCSRGGFTIGQQIQVKEAERTMNMFIKGAFHVKNMEGLYNLRDAVNMAISTIEEEKKMDEEDDSDEYWDYEEAEE